MRKYLFITLTLLITMFSCVNKRVGSFGEDVELTAIELPINGVEIFPLHIMLLDDKLVLLSYNSPDNVFYIFSLPDMELLNIAGRKGRGPREITQLPIFGNSLYDKFLYITGYSSGEVIKWDIDNDGTLVYVENIEIGNAATNLCIMDGVAYYTNLDKRVIEKVDINNGEILGSIPMPDREISMRQTGGFGANREILVFAHAFGSNNIDIYNPINLKKIKTIRTNPVIRQYVNSAERENIITCYTHVMVGQNGFYAIYSGKSSTNPDKSRYLEVYDNSGNPVKRYHINRHMHSFIVDEVNNCVYGVNYGEVDVILKYDLKGTSNKYQK